MTIKPKETHIHVRCSHSFKDEVKEAAKLDNRAYSSFVIAAIKEKIERDKLTRDQNSIMSQREGDK